MRETRSSDGLAPEAASASESATWRSTETRPRVMHPRTMAEQIADDVGTRILDGRFTAGARIGEQELADRYAVSRGPVREAIRLLERRGLVEFFPRRGAFAIGLSLDVIADIFNVRAILVGLASRYFTRFGSEESFAAVEREIEALRALGEVDPVDAIGFALQNGRVGAAIRHNSHNDHLRRINRSLSEESLWAFLWQRHTLDYLTVERRAESIAQWEALLAKARSGDDAGAERWGQQILFDSRDRVLAVLGETRSGSADVRRLLLNRDLA